MQYLNKLSVSRSPGTTSSTSARTRSLFRRCRPATTSRSSQAVSLFTRWLTEQYGIHDQDNVSLLLDRFFDFRRGNRDLDACVREFELVYDEANDVSGLEINDIGRTHLLLKYSEMPQKKIDDIKLKVDGDLRRYNDIKAITRRIAKAAQAQHQHHGDQHFGGEYDFRNPSEFNDTVALLKNILKEQQEAQS